MPFGQIKKQFIEDNAVGSAQARLENNLSLRARNAADSADLNLLKANASDQGELGVKTIYPQTPTLANELVNKSYVDNAFAQIQDAKDAVDAASTGNIDLSAPGATIDGVTMAAGDRFLAKDQTDPVENGIYVWNGDAVPATRADDFNGVAPAGLVSKGAFTWAVGGTQNARTGWILTTANPITIDTTALTFAETPIPGQMVLTGLDTITLDATDLSNGYVDLSENANPDSVDFKVEGAGDLISGVDYTLSVEGGVTRVTFDAGLLALLEEGQLVQGQYLY